MMLPRFLKDISLWLGIGLSLLWSSLLSELSLIQWLEVKVQDSLMTLGPVPPYPTEIRLLELGNDKKTLNSTALTPERYAQVVERLLAAGADTVILNLQAPWLQTTDHDHNPIKQLISRHHDRLVVSIPTTSATLPNPIEWRPYTYFVPVDSRGRALFPLKTILGFWEYEPVHHFPISLESPARHANLTGDFILSNHVTRREQLKAAAWLGLRKFQRFHPEVQRVSAHLSPKPIQVYFWPPSQSFPVLDESSINHPDELASQVAQKLVIVGFAHHQDSDFFVIPSPYGKELSYLAFQATVFGNLLSPKIYRLAPQWLSEFMIVLGGIVMSKQTLRVMLQRQWRWRSLTFLVGSFLSLVLILGVVRFNYGLIFPILLSSFSWSATVITTALGAVFGIRESLIMKQQGEITQLRLKQQAVVLTEVQALLNHIYADIHNGPLQELKLVMDALEKLQCRPLNPSIETSLERLERIGIQLRNKLHNTHVASLKVMPESSPSLALAIKNKLQQLVQCGQLKVKVETQLEMLVELENNDYWLTAREGIFYCFCEAITNVIQHAQSPYGNAHYVMVTLSQRQQHCQLIIENDGYCSKRTVAIRSASDLTQGYGTRLMKSIISELPGGQFRRLIVEQTKLRVIFDWDMPFTL